MFFHLLPKSSPRKSSHVIRRSAWILLSTLLLLVSLEFSFAEDTGRIPDRLKLIESLTNKKEVRQFSLEIDPSDARDILTTFFFQVALTFVLSYEPALIPNIYVSEQSFSYSRQGEVPSGRAPPAIV